MEIISSKQELVSGLLLHSLRLVGNSCADTDENREIVVKGNYTLAIIRHFLNPELIQVALPVIYNICMDYGKVKHFLFYLIPINHNNLNGLLTVEPEPAHAQIAENRSAYIILRLLKDGTIGENEALLSFAYDLVELASEQGMVHPFWQQ